jgi:S-disulfanyl-L-cysteine oxidoreductase SoxD
MSRLKVLLALAILLPGAGGAASPDEPMVGLGVPVDPEKIPLKSITIFPDGRNLPEGKGSVSRGKAVYAAKCLGCHGARGIEGPAARLAGSDGFFSASDPLRILRIRKYPLLVFSVGAQWPYATSLFDYIRRAMPYYAPKSLSDDEVYAVTAYVLHLNGLIKENATLDRESLPAIRMPGLARSVLAWPETP